MGQILLPVCLCFRKNVIATCKIVAILCSLNNFLPKNVFVSFLEIKFQNGAHLTKNGYFDLLFTYFSHQKKDTKNPSAHILLTYIYVFCSPYDFFALPILQQITNLSWLQFCMFLLGVTAGVDSFSHHFGEINK